MSLTDPGGPTTRLCGIVVFGRVTCTGFPVSTTNHLTSNSICSGSVPIHRLHALVRRCGARAAAGARRRRRPRARRGGGQSTSHAPLQRLHRLFERVLEEPILGWFSTDLASADASGVWKKLAARTASSRTAGCGSLACAFSSASGSGTRSRQ